MRLRAKNIVYLMFGAQSHTNIISKDIEYIHPTFVRELDFLGRVCIRPAAVVVYEAALSNRVVRSSISNVSWSTRKREEKM